VAAAPQQRRVDFRLTGPQSRAFALVQPNRDINLEWGRGCGKSWFDRFVAWVQMARYDGRGRLDILRELGRDISQMESADGISPHALRGIRVVFLMPTLKQFKDVHGAGLKSDLHDWAFLGPKPNWTDWRIELPGGSWMQPFPAEAHSSERARGLRADVVICDEADDIDPSVFDSIARPWFSEPWSLKIRLTSGTYKRGRHGLLWRRRQAAKSGDPRYHSIHATYADSPEVVDRSEVEDARRHTAPAVFAREWECDPDSAEGLVYPFSDDFHVREPDPRQRWSEILIGCDHGYEDPGVFLVIGVSGSGRDAVSHVLEEVYEQHQTEDWWKRKLRDISERYQKLGYQRPRFYGDPSMPARIEAYRSCGVSIQDVDNSIEDGVAVVADRLAIRTRTVDETTGKTERFARLFVSPRCVNTIKEFGAYRRKRDPRNREVFLDDIEDRSNHACVARGSLVTTSVGDKPIEAVAAGDMVATRDGWRRVSAAGMTQSSARLWRLQTSNGRALEGTPDHPVFVNGRGWIRLDSVRYGDIITVWQSGARLLLTRLLAGIPTVFAPTLASPLGGARLAATMLSGSVPSAELGFRSTGTARQQTAHAVVVLSGAVKKQADVFNLKVEGAHEFFANGILVHNCDSLRYAIFNRFKSFFSYTA
jgi:hypothetical protein